MLYNKAVKQLEHNKWLRENGEVVAIPWDLPRLSGVLPGITKGRTTIVTAASKVGKTQLADFLYVYQPIEWLINNHDKTNIKLKIFYFSLEIDSMAKIRAAMSYKLFKDYNKIVSPENLQSFFKGYILDDELLKIIKSEEFEAWFKVFEETVEFHDDIRHGYGMHQIIKSYAEKNGKYTYKKITIINDRGQEEVKRVRDSYTPNDPNEYVLIVTDHLALIQPSKEEGKLHTAMGNYSSKYMLEARNRWGYSPVMVVQQAAASEQQQFTFKGDTIIEKLMPSAESLGDNKIVGRDADLMIGLFWPHRYNIENYNGWDLNTIGNNHRELLILLNRHGLSKAGIDLYFDGACNFFKELPKEPNARVYDYIKRMNNLRIKNNES